MSTVYEQLDGEAAINTAVIGVAESVRNDLLNL
jgi:hypothetical protein